MMLFAFGLVCGLLWAVALVLGVLSRYVADDQERFKVWLEGL